MWESCDIAMVPMVAALLFALVLAKSTLVSWFVDIATACCWGELSLDTTIDTLRVFHAKNVSR